MLVPFYPIIELAQMQPVFVTGKAYLNGVSLILKTRKGFCLNVF
jgi:hypothetical protein